jgi:hypothetical protein
MSSGWVTGLAIWGAALSTVLAWSRFLPRPKIILAPWPAERPQSSQLEMRVINSSSWPIEIFRVRRVRLSGKPIEFVPNTDPEIPLSNWFDWDESGEIYLYVPPHSRGSIFIRGLDRNSRSLLIFGWHSGPVLPVRNPLWVFVSGRHAERVSRSGQRQRRRLAVKG